MYIKKIHRVVYAENKIEILVHPPKTFGKDVRYPSLPYSSKYKNTFKNDNKK